MDMKAAAGVNGAAIVGEAEQRQEGARNCEKEAEKVVLGSLMERSSALSGTRRTRGEQGRSATASSRRAASASCWSTEGEGEDTRENREGKQEEWAALCPAGG